MDSLPSLIIGGSDERTEETFDRVVGALRLSDGRIVVADGGFSQLRVFEADGRFVRALGRSGDGPDEFAQIAGFTRGAGDSVTVWDSRHHRLTTLRIDGTPGRSVTATPLAEGLFQPLAGVLADGSFLISTSVSVSDVFRRGSGPRRDSLRVLRYSTDGAFMSLVGTFPGSERYAWVGSSGFSIVPLPFGKRTTVIGHGRELVVATGDSYGIGSFSLDDGRFSWLVRRSEEPQRVTSAEIARYRSEQLLRLTDDPARRGVEARRLDETPYPDRWPAYSEVQVDLDGNLWVRQPPCSGEPNETRWDIFRGDGHPIGAVRSASDLEVLDIGATWILALGRDSLDVESLRLYGLRKPHSLHP